MRRFLLLAASLFSISPAFAQDMPKPLADHKARGAQVFYVGKFDTLDGWVMIRAGQPEFYYATPGNKAVVMGLLFNGNGDLITTEQLTNIPLTRDSGVVDMMSSQFKDMSAPITTPSVPMPETPPLAQAPALTTTAPAPVAPVPATQPGIAQLTLPSATATAEAANSAAANMFTEIEAAASILWGDAGIPALYAFVDPNCPHCQQFLKDFEPLVNAKQVSVHLLPVGYNQMSLRQAAFIMGAGDGASRLLAYAKGDTTILPGPEGISTNAVEANLSVMRKWGLSATPFIVYRAGKTGQVQLIKGSPQNPAAVIADLTGK